MSTVRAALPPGSEQNRAPAYQAFLIFLVVLTTAAVSLRFWSRALGVRHQSGASVRRFWWDDWFALSSLSFIMIFFGVGFAEVHLGFGHHVWMVPPENLPKIFKLLYAIYFLYDICLFLTKTSALLFLARLFPQHVVSKWWTYTLWATHGLNVAWLAGITFGTVFLCSPVQKGWNPMLPGHCGTTSALWTGSAIPSVVIDLIILILPVPRIWSLQLSRARKTGIMLVFVIGYCVIIVSLGRMITVLKSGESLNEDITYEGMPMVYWVSCEAPATLISICLPPMLPLCRHIVSSSFSPLARKISSFLSTHDSRDSSFQSNNVTFTTGLDTSDYTRKARAPRPSHGSHPSIIDKENSIYSMESRSGLVPSTTQYPAPVHMEGSEITLPNITPDRDQYIASIEGGGRGRVEGYSHTPSVAPCQRIRVDRGVSVSRQTYRP